MLKILFETLLQLLLVLPFVFLLLKEKTKINFQRIFAFTFCYLVYQFALVLHKVSPVFDFIKSSWNWEGKLYGIIWGIVAYLIFRRLFKENDFFTLKQDKSGFKAALTGAIGIVLLSAVAWYLLGKAKFDWETLAFQISLPGLDEEIIFRGILLGLLATSLRDKIAFLGSPAVYVTAILFGLTHALSLNKSYAIRFDLFSFFQTAFAGYVWGWITLKSRSILLAVLSHNFSNFFGVLATMIK